MFWGMVFGVVLWIIGPLTVMPILTGSLVAWNLGVIQHAFPDLIGHLWFGAVTAIILSLLQNSKSKKPKSAHKTVQVSSKGIVAGLLAVGIMHLMFGNFFQINFLAVSANASGQGVSVFSLILTGLMGGLLFVFLYPRTVESSGGNLIRGMLYGFFMWIAGPLSLMPLFAGYGLHWDIGLARLAFSGLPGFILFGALLALLYQWIGQLGHTLFGPGTQSLREGSGTVGVRGVLRGTFAGLAGGAIFTFFMKKMGMLTVIAHMAGGTSESYGIMIHLIIAIIIGISYSLMFRRQSVDLGSAMGWGLSYGFFWWVLGGLTIMPFLLGGAPQWEAAQSAAAFPSLIGHLAYGAALGISAFLIERQQNPWWITKDIALEQRLQRELDQLQSSAPALWTLTAILAVLIPALIAV